MLTRRALVAGGAVLAAAPLSCLAPAQAAPPAARPARRIPLGAASLIQDFRGDPRFAALLAQKCDLLVPMNDLKWQQLRPDRDSFDFADADAQIAFAREKGLALRGHTLVWGDALPPWAKALKGPAEAERELIRHIETVVARYRGVLPSWDVVNEVIAHDPREKGPWRDTIWLRLIGPRYIELAFRTAAAVDPAAKLVINDYDFEATDPRTRARREVLLTMVRRMRDKGVPIHGVGFQSHLYGERDIDADGLARFVDELSQLKLDILVTELDVIDWQMAADPAARDQAAAAMTLRYLKAIASARAPAAVVTWGLSDRSSWIGDVFKRHDGLPNRPLPFDADFKPKPLWQALESFCASGA